MKLGQGTVIYPAARIIKDEVIEIGDFSQIDDFAFIYGGLGITIGKYVHICSFVSIIGGGELVVGDYVGIAVGCRLITGTNLKEGHMTAAAPRETQKVVRGKIVLERDVCLGTNVVVFPSVTIGEGAIIGVGSIVRHNIPPWTIWAGVPIRRIGMRERLGGE